MTRSNGHNPRSARKVPIWNEHAFTCPGCGRPFEPATIRILKHLGNWYCHRCVNQMTARTPRVTGPQAAVETGDHCHTCGATFKDHQRTVTNTHGHTVHYRCPRKR